MSGSSDGTGKGKRLEIKLKIKENINGHCREVFHSKLLKISSELQWLIGS